MYRLVFLSGKMKGRRVAVRQGTILIGRDPTCHIDLADDDSVSRKHAQLEQREDGVYLVDLSTTNPIKVNDRPIQKEHKLKQNDKIEIGRSIIQFQPLETAHFIGRRKLGDVQFLTFVAVFVLLVIEVLIVFVLPAFRYDELMPLPSDLVKPGPESEVKAAITNEETVATNQSLEDAELEHAAALLEEMPDQFGAPTNSSTNAPSVASDLQNLREQVDDLKKQFAEVTNVPEPEATQQVVEIAVTNTDFLATDVVETVSAEQPQTNVVAIQVNPELEKAKIMLQEAVVEISRNNLVQADDILEKIETLAPDFLPAYIERAKLYETRGLLQNAGEQWSAVMNRSIGTPLFEQASDEQARLARAEIETTKTPQTPEAQEEVAATMPRKIRIVSVDREKFQASDEFDEMRLFRIHLKPRTNKDNIEPGAVKVVVTFYDRNVETDQVMPSRAVEPEQAVSVQDKWPSVEKKTVTATYVLPKGFRAQEERDIGEKRMYEGYHIKVYYHDQLQDEAAMPKNLSNSAAL